VGQVKKWQAIVSKEQALGEKLQQIYWLAQELPAFQERLLN
jgi:hypothetical protein